MIVCIFLKWSSGGGGDGWWVQLFLQILIQISLPPFDWEPQYDITDSKTKKKERDKKRSKCMCLCEWKRQKFDTNIFYVRVHAWEEESEKHSIDDIYTWRIQTKNKRSLTVIFYTLYYHALTSTQDPCSLYWSQFQLVVFESPCNVKQ